MVVALEEGVKVHPGGFIARKCASQSRIMLITEFPSGHQAIYILIELFMVDMGSHSVGSHQKHVNIKVIEELFK